MLLSQFSAGQRGQVAGLVAGDGVQATTVQRLSELGFIPGEPVQLLRRGPGGREPLAVQVGETLFALRLCEAQCIDVHPQGAT